MDLVYSTLNPVRGWESRIPDWIQETNSLCSVSCQNMLVFSSALPVDQSGVGVNRIYCLDLNSPWDYSLVCTLSSPASCLAWDGSGTKFAVGDTTGNLSIWMMKEYCLSDWDEIYSGSLPHERIIKTGFLSSSKMVRLNTETNNSVYYNDKFQFGPQGTSLMESEVCIFVTSSGLLNAVVFNQSVPISATACVGRKRSRISFVDMATSTTGDFLLAACGAETPVTIYRIDCSLQPQLGLTVHVTNHSSFCVTEKGESDMVRIAALKFVLADCSDAITVGLDTEEGGKVRMWEMELSYYTSHKLFTQTQPSPKRKLVPNWRYCSEFGGGGAKLNVLATPRSSIMGGDKPSCYIIAGFADGTIQCLIRDSLQQIASVELPRTAAALIDTNSQNITRSVTICDMCFTSTGTGLLVTDSHGQLYLYRMSPIADPGGPHVAPYLVTMYEYCLVSGRDWWDLALPAVQTNIQTITDKLQETFSRQPQGVQNFCYYRYMSIRGSLYRLCSHSQYRAADTLSLMMLKSIYGDLSSLLSLDGSLIDQEPVERMDSILRNTASTTQLDNVISTLVSSGFVRELDLSSEDVQNLIHLSNWVVTLALHLLSAVPEFSTRGGPGFWLMQEGGLNMIRDILVMLRLWALPKAEFITREKDMDLNAKLFSMVCRLRDQPNDENLRDECLILPSLVIVPGLDVMVAPSGVLAGLQSGANLPFSFTFGVEPNFCLAPQPLFLEGLPYTDEGSSRNIYDSIRKIALGRQPNNLRKCNRCRSFTQRREGKFSSLRNWEKRWNKNCFCGGSWKLVENS